MNRKWTALMLFLIITALIFIATGCSKATTNAHSTSPSPSPAPSFIGLWNKTDGNTNTLGEGLQIDFTPYGVIRETGINAECDYHWKILSSNEETTPNGHGTSWKIEVYSTSPSGSSVDIGRPALELFDAEDNNLLHVSEQDGNSINTATLSRVTSGP